MASSIVRTLVAISRIAGPTTSGTAPGTSAERENPANMSRRATILRETTRRAVTNRRRRRAITTAMTGTAPLFTKIRTRNTG